MKFKTLVKSLDEYTDAGGGAIGSMLELIGDLDLFLSHPDMEQRGLYKAYIEVLEYKGVRFLISDWGKVKKELLKQYDR